MPIINLYYRAFQKVTKVSANFLDFRVPKLIKGENSVLKIANILSKEKEPVFVVTGSNISRLGLLDSMLKSFDDKGIHYVVYDKVVPNPTINNIEEAVKLYNKNSCKSIIAFGGGSPIDCAKAVGARIANPKKTVPQMKGLLKVGKKLPMFVAIPTTAGTGSETTLAAVVSNPDTNEKYAISDPHLIPNIAVLDPSLTVGLPKGVTSTTGMDALTHAVEAYIGKSNTNATKKYAINATKLIFKSLKTAYDNGEDIVAREDMQQAAFEAGLAFTRAYVGNVHAIAHTLGGFYGVPHGLANAVILPYVLEYYGSSVYKTLSELGFAAGVSDKSKSDEENAKRFIVAIKELNLNMDIPEKIEGIKDEDIPKMIDHAYKEANPLYPVPRIFTKEDFYNIYKKIQV